MSQKASGLDSMSPYRVRWPEARSSKGGVLVGVVHSGETVCHVSVAATWERLARELARYVRESAPYQLCRGDAERVEELLGRGHWRQAVDHYFGAAVQRWSRERLVVQRVDLATDP